PPAAGSAAPPAGAAAPRLDPGRLLADVALLAHDSMEGRATGTPGALTARQWLVAELGRIGLEPTPGGFERPFTLVQSGRTLPAANVAGLVRGRTRPDRVIVLSAHFDHLGVRGGQTYNGADDNASGVAAVLGIARWLVTRPIESTVLVVFLDAEELGLRGARAFVADPPVPLADMALDLNLDMIGRNARDELWIAGTSRWPALRPLAEAVQARNGIRVRLGHDRSGVGGEDDWTGSSDHGAFDQAGVPFLYFGEEDHPDYHQPTDDVERIDREFLGAAAELVLDVLLMADTVGASFR
ncbi:MAG: M28 family peptidase, partial [Gemmatimonadales bacterium]